VNESCVACRHPEAHIIHEDPVCYASLAHLSGFVPGILSLIYGLSVHLIEKFNIETFLNIIENNEVCNAITMVLEIRPRPMLFNTFTYNTYMVTSQTLIC